MSTFKCKMCGGTLDIKNGITVVECEYCGTKQTLPKLDDEKRVNLYERANHFRRNNEFDKAAGIYEQILNEDDTDSEAYWSLVLCRYGIEYVEDASSRKRIPTINRAQFTSVFDDDNYKSAIKNADSYQRVVYEAEAKNINEIQKNILSISQKEEPFDVFICYKETDNNGRRTPDSVLAQELYYQLTQEGFKVFFSRITLENKLGSAYEPYIFAALNSSKVMVVVGTKTQYFNAVWVKNEWGRFLSLIKNGQKKTLIPAYKDMEPYNLPKEFSHLQAQDMSKLGFMQDLIRGIKKIVGKDKKPIISAQPQQVIVNESVQNISPLLRRAFLFLEDRQFEHADEYAEKILDVNPECAEAYVVKLMAELCVSEREDLKNQPQPFDDNPNYKKIIRFGDDKLKRIFAGYTEYIDIRNKETIYNSGLNAMNSQRYEEAVSHLQKIVGYKDAEEKINKCKELIEIRENEKVYNAALQSMNFKLYRAAMLGFSKIPEYKDSKEKIEECKELEQRSVYQRAMQALKLNQFDEAIRLFKSIETYSDSKEKIEFCIEERENIRKERIYCQTMQQLSHATTSSSVKNCIDKLRQISGFKDVDTQLEYLTVRLEQYKKREIKAKEVAEKARKRRRKVFLICLSSIMAIAAVLILIFNFIIPLTRYNKANRLVYEGKYDEAKVIYRDLGDFLGSKRRIRILNTINLYILDDDPKFASGIRRLLNEGVIVTVTYETNGGQFENDISTVIKYTSINDFEGLNIPSKDGYFFDDWQLTNHRYKSNGTFELTLTAIYNTKEYSIKYILNDGQFDGYVPTEYNPEDETFSLPIPSKDGCHFIGWIGTDIEEYSTTVTIEKGSFGDKEYEAHWQPIKYVITLNPNGGSVSQNEIIIQYGQVLDLPTPTLRGYRFIGWYDNDKMFNNDTWLGLSDITLTARWDIVKYTITYNLNGGENSSLNPSEYTVEDDITLSAPQKSGHIFIGWTCQEDEIPALNVVISAGTIGDKIYTANFEPCLNSLKFDANGGSGFMSTISIKYGQSIILPQNSFVRDGYEFLGWSREPDGDVIFIDNDTYTMGIDNEYTLYAIWAKIYSITYQLNDGTFNKINKTSYTALTDDFSIENPTRKGYKFTGWSNDAGDWFSTDINIKKGSTGDLFLSANYQSIVSYTIDNDTKTCSVNGLNFNDVDEVEILTEYDGYKVVGIEDRAFEGKTAITKVIIPPTVTSIGYSAFSGCSSLQEITLPFVGMTIGDYRYPFGYIFGSTYYIGGTEVQQNYINRYYNDYPHQCSYYIPSNLKKVTILNGKIHAYAFYNCTQLTNVILSKNLTSIDTSAFENCNNLTSITIPDTVTSIGSGAFYNCTALNKVNYTGSIDQWVQIEFSVFNCNPLYYAENLYIDNELITDIYITTAKKISNYALYNCSSLTSIIIGDCVKTIGESALRGCNRLQEITIPFLGNSITASDYMKVFGYLFGSTHNCLVDEAVYQYSYNGREYYYYIPASLRKVTVTNGDIPEYAFYNCENLTNITLFDNVTSIGDYAFYNCESLTNIIIPDDVTLIGERAFYNCNSITNVIIPNKVNNIGAYTFFDCSSLTTVTILGNITSIGKGAFALCDSLTTITIPAVNKIEDSAFWNCVNLKKVFYGETIDSWNTINISVFENTNIKTSEHYYYSETQPIDNGNYWHYDEKGNVVEW